MPGFSKWNFLLLSLLLVVIVTSCGEEKVSEKVVSAEEVSNDQPVAATEPVVTTGAPIEAEVMVMQVSEVPPPQTAPYPDCLTHIKAKVISADGELVREDRTLNLVTWAFRNREWDDGGLLRRGCRMRIKAVDFFSGTTSDIQQLQRVDDINEFDLPPMWLDTWQLTEGVLASFTLPPRDETVRKQKELIQHILSGYGDLVIGGVHDGWFFDLKGSDHYRTDFWKEFEHRNPNIQGSFEAILTFHQQLAERGIKLHLVIAPRSATIYPDLATNIRYDPNVHGRVNEAVAAFGDALRSEGVDVIDLTPDLLGQRYYKFKYVGDGEQRFPVFLPNDHHWSPIGVRLAAKAIASHLVDQGFDLPKEELNFFEKKHLMAFSGVPYADWIYPPYQEIDQVFDTPYYTLIPKDESAESALDGISDGPVHLIGDSFTWCHKRGSNLISHLTKELRQPLVFTGAAGGAETNVRQSWVSQHADSEVKHLIWLVGENALGNHERWHRVNFDDSRTFRLDIETTSAETVSSGKGEGSILPGKIGEWSFQIGQQALPAGQRRTWRLTSKDPVTFTEASFLDAQVRLQPVVEGQHGNESDYRFKFLIGDQVAATKYEKTTDLSWIRDWREDLSEFAGQTATVSFEIEVEVGEQPQEGFPMIVEPQIENIGASSAP